jgi:hypothetical protein
MNSTDNCWKLDIIDHLPDMDRRCDHVMQELVRRLADDNTMTKAWINETLTECFVFRQRIHYSGVLDRKSLRSNVRLAHEVIAKAQAIRMMLQTYNEIGE